MLTASHIKKYGIAATYDSYASTEQLFSNGGLDPVLSAENMAHDIAEGCFWDISVAICEGGKCVTQIIIFRNKAGYELYKSDGITVFDQKESERD